MSFKEINLPQLKMKLYNSTSEDNIFTCLLIAGGRKPDQQWLRNLLEISRFENTYAADKGLKYFLGNNIIPDVVIGDADSAGKITFEEAEGLGAKVYTYPIEKDDTDLQLALKKINAGDLVVSGIWGGRFDHLYSNVFSLAKHKVETLKNIIMADDKEIMIFLQANDCVEVEFSEINDLEAISILPLSNSTKVTIKGVHWPLCEKELSMYEPYAISNVLDNSKNLFCECINGMFGLYLNFK